MLNLSTLKSLKIEAKKKLGTNYWRYTFDEMAQRQKDFIDSDSRFLLLEASRRSGKSVALAERMIKKTTTPVVVNGKEVYGSYIYIAPTKNDAKSIIWNELKKMCKKRGQPYTSHEVELKMTFPEGGFIQLEGAGLASSADKSRGKKNVGIAIDEAAFIHVLRELVGLWRKTTYDYNGEIVLCSSPGKSKSGYFYSCSRGKDSVEWDQFFLKGNENPLFKNGRYEELIAEDLRVLYGGNALHPEYVRECLGQWVEDTTGRLIKFNEDVNLYKDIHPKNTDLFDYIIGLDIGYLDSTSMAVIAVAKYEPLAIFVDEFCQAEMRIGDIVTKVEEYSKKWEASLIAVDSGGMGHHTYRELIAREGLPAVDRAQKYGKKLNIELLNNELHSRRIYVMPNCKRLINAWKLVLKNEKGTEDEKTDYGEAGILDILDAGLYASMEAHPAIHDQLAAKLTPEQELYERKMKKHRDRTRNLSRHGMSGFIK